MQCWKCKRATLKLPNCALPHWQIHFFSPSSFCCGFIYTSYSTHWFPDLLITTKHNLEIFYCLPESHFLTFSLRDFELWNSLLFEEVKNKNGLRKYLNELIERSVVHSDYSSLDSFYQSTIPRQYLLSGRAEHFLPFLVFTIGQCQ